MTSSFPPDAAIAWNDAARAAAFAAWMARVASRHGIVAATLRPASSDASFRRYLRADRSAGGSVVVMDAPPPQEDVRPFVHVAGLIAAAGLHAPRVLEQDIAHGFLLLDDLGSELYLHALQSAQADGDAARADRLMRDAIAALVAWQEKIPAAALPPYDEALLRRELELFPTWCVARECGATWSAADAAVWKNASDLLVAAALAQPIVAVHRDWMPRNLMLADPNPGILDFQDAVAGPIAYDVASLLRDAFISWDEERELDWAIRYWEGARKAKLPVQRGLRRSLARRRMDRPAASPEGARHLLAPEASRRQARVQRRPAALLRVCAQGGDALRGAPPARPSARVADGRRADRSVPLNARRVRSRQCSRPRRT